MKIRLVVAVAAKLAGARAVSAATEIGSVELVHTAMCTTRTRYLERSYCRSFLHDFADKCVLIPTKAIFAVL